MQMKPEQLEIIKEQFKTLKDRSAFYARKFKDIDLSDVQTQEDFEKLPFSEKADLREAYPLGLQAVPDEKIIRIHSSSGTTGTPVVIPYTQKDVDDWATMFARCYETAGITNTDRIQITPGYGLWTAASASSWAASAWVPWPSPWSWRPSASSAPSSAPSW